MYLDCISVFVLVPRGKHIVIKFQRTDTVRPLYTNAGTTRTGPLRLFPSLKCTSKLIRNLTMNAAANRLKWNCVSRVDRLNLLFLKRIDVSHATCVIMLPVRSDLFHLIESRVIANPRRHSKTELFYN